MKIPMPSPRSTNFAKLFMKVSNPTGAFDSAPADKSSYQELIVRLGQWAVRELTDEQAAQLNNMINSTMPNESKLAGDDAEGLDKVLAFLKSRGLDDEALAQCRELLGGAAGDDDKPGLPMKHALDRLPPHRRLAELDRLHDRNERAEESFLRHFPEARRIG